MKDTASRIDAPKFPSMIKYSRAKDVVIVDFFNLKHLSENATEESYETFSSIVMTEQIALDMIANLSGFINKINEEEKD